MANIIRVFISVSKIQFESKSQQSLRGIEFKSRCLSVCQRYNLKANHNGVLIYSIAENGVFISVSKIQFESKSQQKLSVLLISALVFISVSKIQFESKSQPDRHAPV